MKFLEIVLVFSAITYQHIDCIPTPSLTDYLGVAVQDVTIPLYKQLIREKTAGHFVYSPLGFASELTLLLPEASGEAAEEIKRLLHYIDPVQRISAENAITAFSSVFEEKQKLENKSYDYYLSNSLWIQSGIEVFPNYYTTVRDKLATETFEIDFTNKSAIDQINKWSNVSTKGQITDVFKTPLYTGGTMLILNLAYFKLHFTPEDKIQRRLATYHHPEGKTTTKMIYFYGKFKIGRNHYMEGVNYQTISIPYKDSRFVLILIIPDKVGINELDQMITKDLNGDIDFYLKTRSDTHNVLVGIPEFSISSTLELAGHLDALGVQKAFIHGQSKFKNIGHSSSLYVSDVFQKAKIDVTASGPVLEGDHPALSDKTVTKIVADRPFLFVLRDKENYIFMGRHD